MKPTQIHETKTDCKILKHGLALDATIHLIEIRYNGWIAFWNGVLQMTKDDIRKLGEITDTPLDVHLPDGRTGYLHLIHARAISTEAPVREGYFELAGVGRPTCSVKTKREIEEMTRALESLRPETLQDKGYFFGVLHALNWVQDIGTDPLLSLQASIERHSRKRCKKHSEAME